MLLDVTRNSRSPLKTSDKEIVEPTVDERGAMESSPHLESRSSRTASPQNYQDDRGSAVVVGTSADDEEMRYSPIRKTPLNTKNTESYNSYPGRPPPSSPTDTTPLTALEKDDTLAVVHDHITPRPHVKTMIVPRTPPRSAQRSLNATTTAGPSPSRALSLPMTPSHRPALTEASDSGPVTPHRATSAMAKRSAASGPGRKVTELPSSTAASLSTSKSTSKRKKREEEEEGGDDMVVPSTPPAQTGALAATQSMPDLRESPIRGHPIAFLGRLVENQKKALQSLPSVVEFSSGRSTAETEVGSSASQGSREYKYHSRYLQHEERPVFRPLTQKAMGENPPGIDVHSQSQSEPTFSHSSGEYHAPDERDFTGMPERLGRTLVAGTPSETSESSQPDRDLDMSQLYQEGRSFMPDATQEELIPTQVVVGSQDMETQPVEEYAITQSLHEGRPLFRSPAVNKPFVKLTQTVIDAVDISPRKQKGFWSSSSGASSSIPGLSNPENGIPSDGSQPPKKSSNSPQKIQTQPRMEYTPSNPTSVSVYPPPSTNAPTQSTTPVRPNRQNSLRTSRPPDANIPQDGPSPRNFGLLSSAEKTLKKPAPGMPKKNGLMRRRSPQPQVERWILEKAAKMEREIVAMALRQDEETLPVDHATETLALVEEETQSPPLYPELHKPAAGRALLEATSEATVAIGDTLTVSENEGSVVMETDEEPLLRSATTSPVFPRSHWRDVPPELQLPADCMPKADPVPPVKPRAFLLSGLTREDTVCEPSPPRAISAGTKRSDSTTVGINTPVEWEGREEDEEESSSADDDNQSDYRPQETQMQSQDDVFEEEVVVEEEEGDDDSDDEEARLFAPISGRGTRKKRDSKSQGGRNSKRICRRPSPKALSVATPLKEILSPRRPPSASKNEGRKAMLPPLDTGGMGMSISGPSRRATRSAQTRARAGSKATSIPEVGRLVLVRYTDVKRYYLGYAVSRTGRLWSITPCDGSATMYAEPKHMRDGIFHVDDLVSVSADSGGENCGDAIVIAVDEHWDEDRTVKVRIGPEGGMEERYVAVRHLSVVERNIKQWDDRKISHEHLQNEEAMENMPALVSASRRSNSFAVPTPARSFSSSVLRVPQVSSGKIFSGVGFILTGCDDWVTKQVSGYGGYIYESWLSVFEFDGGFENVKGHKNGRRWIRRLPGVQGKGKGKSIDSSPVQWIGNEHEQGVKTMFVVAGKVVMTPKTLIALSFGIPCISDQWVKACESAGQRVGWAPYLIPSHNGPHPFIPGASPCQAPDYQWGSEKHWSSPPLEDILAHEALAHRRILYDKPRVLYIAPGCTGMLAADYDEHLEFSPCQVPFVYCCLAMGAQHVEAVEEHTHATDQTLSKYDLIVVADAARNDKQRKSQNKSLTAALTAAKESGNTTVLDHASFKMSIACGKLLKI